MATATTPPVHKIAILNKLSIHCGFHLVPHIVHTLLTLLPSSTYVLITDTIVAKFHLSAFIDEFTTALQQKPARFLYTTLPPGETSKTRQQKADLEDFLLLNKCTRDTVILALGGGVIGDLVGFVAATFMRGVRFCQIPTTLLAMVDSSIGGKTAIDTPHGKNLIGAFWQPEFIFIDTAFLQTLPPREFSNGMAEVIKTAAIWNEDEFSKLESRADELFAALHADQHASSSRDLLLSVIVASISVKAHIVTVDERESGLRMLVNFGHSIGHAIEAVLTPAILHGECIAIGMILEAELSRQRGALSQVAVGRLSRCLRAYNLPVSLTDPRITAVPAAAAENLSVDRLLDIMALDKKNAGPVKRIVLLKRIGECLEPRASAVPDAAIRTVLAPAVRVVPGLPAHHPVRMATPGSKSISNRALLLAALATGTTRLRNLLHSDDTQVMMAALLELGGATFAWEDNGETLVVHGGGGALVPPPEGKEIYLGNAGTASRFLTAVCTLAQPATATAAPTAPTHTVITGNARMQQRPVGPLVDALRDNGCEIAYTGTEGCLPLRIGCAGGGGGGLRGGRIRLAASVSSQYVSAVLLCAPYARDAPVELELVGGAVVSQLYIDMTVALMHEFGIDVVRRARDAEADGEEEEKHVYVIPQGRYTSPGDFSVESDASSATYPLAVAAATGTTCTLANIGSASLQGDARFARDVLAPMGCAVVQSGTETTVTGPARGGLRALGCIDMEPMTDAFLTASVLAAMACEAPLPERRLADGSPLNTTRIVGIANQRVKECNRIRAMMDQLAKFGVETKELDDGLEIYGRPMSELKEGASIHCYDDHRVAMAFSVLGAVVKGTVIEEKRCVEKTWPNWWDDLQNKIGLSVEGTELPKSESATSLPAASASVVSSQQQQHQASVVLIGMRGSGKTFIGKLAARTLGWTFLDADHAFEAHHATTPTPSVRAFVHAHGWPAFRAAELALLRTLLAEHPTGHILSLGGGIVETPEARALLQAYGESKMGGPVVEVVRERERVLAYLEREEGRARPAYGEPVEEVMRRRGPWFEACATHQFANWTEAVAVRDDDASGGDVCGEIARFFRHITGVAPNWVANVGRGLGLGHGHQKRRSYFLSLTYPDVTRALGQLDELTAGVDAIELRVDLLRDPATTTTTTTTEKESHVPSKTYVMTQLAALRRHTSLPIVFTVRSQAQGGAHPDGPAGEDAAFELFDLALRMGCEYIDVELGWSEDRVRALRARAHKGFAKVIASWHDWSGAMRWDGEEVRALYARGAAAGDIVKLVGRASCVDDNLALRAFVAAAAAPSSSIGGQPQPQPPLIAINTGYAGQLSRVLNETLSPVTHPLLPFPAAPGQLSFAEIQTTLHLIGALPQRRYFLFGTPIKASPSPTLHHAGFEALGLPHRYERFETAMEEGDAEAVKAVERVVRSEAFGGASVTIPCKRAMMRVVDELTVHARAIGAVNTVVAVEEEDDDGEKKTGGGKKKILRGDNTDWIGIRNCVLKHLPSLSSSSPAAAAAGASEEDGPSQHVGLVIGAGGTARAALYALHALGVPRILLFNRTRAKAEALAGAFPEYGICVIDRLDDGGQEEAHPPPTIIISTVPGSATTVLKNENNQPQEEEQDAPAEERIHLPACLFRAPRGGVVVDMAYKPAETPLLALAAKVESESEGKSETGGPRARWGKVRGVEVLLEQGYAQFEMWTGRRAPKRVMREKVLEWYSV